MNRQKGMLLLLGRLGALTAAVLLASGGLLSLVLGGCGWTDGSRFCGGDVARLTEGYGAGVALMGAAAACAALAWTRRWSLVLGVVLTAMAASVLVVLRLESVL